jgi:hypothetical protein
MKNKSAPHKKPGAIDLITREQRLVLRSGMSRIHTLSWQINQCAFSTIAIFFLPGAQILRG